MSTYVGTSLSGRYRLDAQVGTGGMSTVYRAFDTVLERQVAVKLMHRDIAHNPDQLERFRREARAVAQLNHPHVVGVIDAGQDSDPTHPMPYIVLEFIQGETLKDRIRRFGGLQIPEALAYAIEIARALGAAHDRGIVHRDVKPQNVMIDEEGSAKVTDFGIARTLEQDGLTADGRVLGTTDYVSPEQALGHAVTGQSDLYSLGVVLYEMLVGDVPFKGENQIAVAMKHVREDLPDVQFHRPEVSSALAAVLDRATAKDLGQRYRDDRELIADLEEVLTIETARSGHATGEATTVLRTLPPSARRRVPLRLRTSMLAVVGLTVVVIGVLVAIGVFAADQTEKGTGSGAGRNATPAPSNQLEDFSLKQNGAEDYDPLGGDGEHADEASAVLDRDDKSTWSTETYPDGLTKDGVGIMVDASPGVAAAMMTVATPTPGFTAEVYGTMSGTPPEQLDDDAWVRLANARTVADGERIELESAGNRYRHFLLWITELPEGDASVEVAELRLYRRQNR